MLEKINNFTLKSYKNYSGPEDVFKRINIFFGYNGKGKTALSIGIINEITKNPIITNENYRFFNKDYINNNLLIENGQEIKGIVANFGEKNVEIENSIKEKTNQIIDLEPLNVEKTNIENKITDEITKIFNSKRNNLQIKRKSIADYNDVYSTYNRDLEEAMKIVKSKDELKKNKRFIRL